MNATPSYTKGEEIFNAVSHGVGSLLAVVGSAVMITLAAIYSGWLAVVSSVIYGLSLVVLFTMSTLYHAIPYPRVKKVMRILDHDSIFVLIAGTYTPITLLTLRDSPRGIVIFCAVWAAAAVGAVLNAVDMHRFRRVGMLLYVVMGWAVLSDLGAVMRGLGSTGFGLLLSGGICYTVGIVFYKLKRIPFMHGVWHLFVVSGSVLHYFCILFFVVLAAV